MTLSGLFEGFWIHCIGSLSLVSKVFLCFFRSLRPDDPQWRREAVRIYVG